MPSEDVLLRMKVDTSDFSSNMKEIGTSMSQLKADFKTATAGMDGWSKSSDGVKAKITQLKGEYEQLGKKLQLQKTQLDNTKTAFTNNAQYADQLRQKLQDLKNQGYSETSPEVQKLEAELSKVEGTMSQQGAACDKLKTDIQNTESAMQKTATQTEKYEQKLGELEAAEEKARSASEKLKTEIGQQKDKLADLESKYESYVINNEEGSDAAKQLADEIKQLSSEIKDNENKLEEAETATKKLSEEYQDLDSSSGKAKTASEQLKSTISQEKTELENLKTKYTNLVLEQKTETTEAQNVKREIEQLSSSLKEHESALESAEGASESLVGGSQSLWSSFSEGVSGASMLEGGLQGLAIAAGEKVVEMFGRACTAVKDFAVDCVQTGMSFDSSMSNVKAISGTAGQDFVDLRNKALEMGSSTKFSASEAADAFGYMAMAGWKSEQMIDGIPGVLNLAAASGEDLALTSDILTDGLTAFGLSAGDAGHMADVMAAASSNANTNVSMLGESFKYVAPVAGSMGYSLEDTSVALGLMANSGIKASSAGTSLRSIMSRMAAPTKEVSQAMDQLGISIEDGDGNMYSFMDVMKQMREKFADCKISVDEYCDAVDVIEQRHADGTITSKEYNQAMDDLEQQCFGAEGALKAQAAAAIAGKSGMSGLLAIVGASDEDFNKLCDSIYNADGAAEEMAAIMGDNLAGDLTIAGSAVEGFKIMISDSLTPAIRPVVQLFSEFVSWLTAIGTGAEPLPWILQPIADTWQAVCEVIKTAWETFAQPVLDFVGEHFQRIADELNEHAPVIMETWNSVCQVFQTAWDGIVKPALSFMKEGIELTLDGLATAFSIFVDLIGAGVDMMCSFWNDVLLPAIQNVVNIVVALLEGDWSGAWESAKNLVSDFVHGVGDFLSTCVSAIGNFVSQAIQQAADFAVQFIWRIASWGADLCSKVNSEMTNFVSEIAQGLSQGVIEFANGAAEMIANFCEGIINGIGQAVQAVIDWGRGVVDGFMNFWSGGGEGGSSAQQAGQNASDNFNNGLSTMPAGAQATMDATQSKADAFSNSMGTTGTKAGIEFGSGLNTEVSKAQVNTSKSLDTMTKDSDSFEKNFTTNGKEAGDGFNKGMEDGLSKVPPTAEKTFSDVKSSADTFKSDMTSNATQTGNEYASNLDSGLSQATTNANTQFNNVRGSADSFKADMAGKATETGNTYSSNLNSGLSSAKGQADANFNGISSSAAQTASQVGQEGSNAGSMFTNNIVSTLSPAVGQATSIGTQISNGIANGIGAGLGNVVAQAQNVVAQAIAAAKAKADVNSPSRVFRDQVGIPISEGMAVGIKKGSKLAINEVNKLSDELIETASINQYSFNKIIDGYRTGALNDTTSSITDSLAGELLNNFAEAPEVIFEELETSYQEILGITDDFAVQFVEFSNNASNQFKEYVINGITETKSEFDEIVKTLEESAETFSGNFTAEGQNAGSGYRANFIDAHISLLPENVEQLLGEVLKIMQKFIPMMAQAGKDAGEAYASEIRKAINAAKNAAAEAVKSSTTEIGEQITAGISAGIEDSKNVVTNSIKGVTEVAIKTAKDSLEIKSPSKVFKEQVGRFIPEGLAEGVKAYAYKASNSVKEMTGTLVNATKPLKNDLKGSLSKLDMNLNNNHSEPAQNVVNFYQNNTSPKALSRKEIYRQTKNALAFVKV